MTDPMPPSPRRRGNRGLLVVLAVLLVAGLAGWRGWVAWQARETQAQGEVQGLEQRVVALEQRLEALRRDQRAQTQRIQDAAATNRVLRDEVLGLSQRGALLEDSVAKLADTSRHGAQALRLDEVELLLSQAQQRLAIAGDVEGARRAYALAAGALQGVDDPRLLNLGQALGQERLALEANGAGPRAALAAQLDAFANALTRLPARAAEDDAADRPAWQRLLAPLVDIRPTTDTVAIAPSARAAGIAALQIELALARAALERNDAPGFQAALRRVQAWLPQLWPDSPALQQRRNELQALRAAPLQADPPVMGSTLQQLRLIRNAGAAPPVPALPALPAPTPAPKPGVEP